MYIRVSLFQLNLHDVQVVVARDLHVPGVLSAFFVARAYTRTNLTEYCANAS